jgi:prolyl-tRNA synthetase
LKIPIYCDLEVCALSSFVCGANAADAHYKNVVSERDYTPTVCGDFREAAVGDLCPRCEKGHFTGYRGVEVGQVFFLGTKYSVPMKCNFLDADGKEKPMVMGTYGIGVTRIAAAAIEQNHDKDGIVWPVAIAPFEVALLSLQAGDAQVTEVAERLYAELNKAGVEVLFDDRDERPGVKFKDADLIGLPYRIAVGKKGVAEGTVELKARRSPEVVKVKIEDAVRMVSEKIVAGRAGSSR